MKKFHKTVFKKKAVDLLKVKANQNFIDCTAGEGGHVEEIIKRNGPEGEVLAFEWDKKMYERLLPEVSERVHLVNKSYIFLEETVNSLDFGPVSGIILDLGMSTWHIKKSGRGFSFQKDEPLDMRYDSNLLLTAEEIINNWKKKDIEKIIRDYSDERYAKEIAEEIIRSRPLKTTGQLVEVIKRCTPENYERGRIHPATRTFQALRITVNAEINNLKEVLPQASRILEKEGKIVVISFHYLEDEEVENFIKKAEGIREVKKVTPSERDIVKNPSSRSAILRLLKKVDEKEVS